MKQKLTEGLPDITKFVKKVGDRYYLPKNKANELKLHNGDNIIIRLGGLFNKLKGYVAETLPASDVFQIIKKFTPEELLEKGNLNEELIRSKRMMGIVEGLNLPKRQTKDLIDRVIEEIKMSIQMGDIDALDELLQFIPKENLLNFLPEEEWNEYRNWDINNRPDPI